MTTVTGPRQMPSVRTIIDHWRTEDPAWLKSWYIGWGEPFCFGCGWFPPVVDGRLLSWELAGRWLDRAHLQDHAVAGDDSPANLVMLCWDCHDVMPGFDDRESALEWVRARPACDAYWQLYSDSALRRDRPNRVRFYRAKAQMYERLFEISQEMLDDQKEKRHSAGSAGEDEK